MYRLISSTAAVTAFVVSSVVSHRTPSPSMQPVAAPPIDVAALIAAAHGTSPMMCSLAARSVGSGWGSGMDVPAPPLGRETMQAFDRGEIDRLPEADVQQLFAAMETNDPCVREVAVRLIGDQDSARVAPGLIARLTASDPALRAVAAMGLGLTRPGAAVSALERTLRDAQAAVRANTAWALGRIRDGSAFASLLPVMRDQDATVREAAVGAVGHMDSTRAVTQLTEVLLHDDSPRVRRVAAWALGQLRVGEASAALSSALSHDADAGVRAMAAWALVRDDDRTNGIAALRNALRSDADDTVREMAAWALGSSRDASVTDALVSAAEGDRSSRVRGTAAWALGSIRDDDDERAQGGNAGASRALTHLLSDSSTSTRARAAWALGQVGAPSAVPAIRGALAREKNSEVRLALVRALTLLGGASTEALAPLINSRDPRAREMAVRALAGRRAIGPWPWPEPRPRPFP